MKPATLAVHEGVYVDTSYNSVTTPMGYQFSLVDMREPDNVRAEIRSHTRAIWIETPSNPLLHLVDIQAVTGLARQHELLSIVDNTFMTISWRM